MVALAAQGATEQAAKPAGLAGEERRRLGRQNGPAAYAQLIFAAHATGADPRAFGGTDLVEQLNATGPTPPQQAGHGGRRDAPRKKDDSDSGFGVWWIVGVGLVAGIGIGFLLSGRRKKQRQP